MKKKNRFGILLLVGFFLLAGILYTVSYIRPWKKDPILLDGEKVSDAVNGSLDESASQSVSMIEEDITPNDTEKTEHHTEDVPPNETDKSMMVVHICGAVKNPGVYEVADGTRLNDIVMAAGGLTKKAAAEFVNLAQTIVDGQQYYIPSQSDVEGMDRLDTTDSFNADALNPDTMAAGVCIQNQTDSGSRTSGKININTATREELMTLPGVGESKADAVIAYRETVSQFETVEDIKKVNGIKDGLFQKISAQITVR